MADTDLRRPPEYSTGYERDTEAEPEDRDEEVEYAEYDENAPAQEDGAGAFDSETREEQQPEQQEDVRQPSPAFNPPQGPPDFIREKLTELLGDEGLSLMDAYLASVIGQREQYSALASYHVHSHAQQHPDWHRENAGSLNRIMGQMNPSARGTKEGLEAAIQAVIFEEAQASGDLAATLERHAAMLRGKGSGVRGQGSGNSPQVMPPKERVPTAGSPGSGSRAVPARLPGKQSVQARVAARWGKSGAAALLDED